MLVWMKDCEPGCRSTDPACQLAEQRHGDADDDLLVIRSTMSTSYATCCASSRCQRAELIAELGLRPQDHPANLP